MESTRNDMIYLGVPYSHPDPEVREQRVRTFCLYDTYLAGRGFFTISPMHKLLNYRYDPGMPTTWEWWRDYSSELMRRCDRLIILQLPGWDTSEGTQAEIELAQLNGLMITYVSEQEIVNALAGGRNGTKLRRGKAGLSLP